MIPLAPASGRIAFSGGARHTAGMKINGAGRWLGLAAILWVATASGEETKDALILRVFDSFYTASELGLSANASTCRELEPLVKTLMGSLFADYCEKAGISVGEEDLKEYCRRQLPGDVPFEEAWAQWAPGGGQWRMRKLAIAELTMWKLQQSLFEKYGGRVARVGGAQPQAFDAMCAYAAERKEAGDFTFHDARLEIRFWECLRAPKDPLVSGEDARALIAEHPADRLKRGRTEP